MKKYLIVSCETSGLNFEKLRHPNVNDNNINYVMVSVGMVVTDDKFNKLDELYLEIDYSDYPKLIAWDKDAIAIHSLSSEHLRESGLPVDDAIEEICSFLFTHFETNVIPLVGHNPGTFVFPFLDDLLKTYELPFKFSTNMIDLSTLGIVLLGAKNKRDIFTLFNVSKQRNALIDARSIGKCLQQITKMWNTIL